MSQDLPISRQPLSLPNEPTTAWQEARALLVLAAPIIAAMLSRLLMGFTDFYMVSFLGTDATAAISPAIMLMWTFLCLGMGLVTSVQTFASQSVGRGRPEDAAAYTWQTLYVAVAFVFVTLAVSPFMRTIWTWIDAPAEIQRLEADYCAVAIWSLPFGVACAGLEGFFTGVQRPGVTLKALLAALVFNVIGNYCLIFGKFGFPAMGVSGAALATVLGWALRVAILLAVFLSEEFQRQFRTVEGRSICGEKILALVKLGGPMSVQWVLDVGAWFIFLAVLIQGMGKAALAASNIGVNYMHIAFMPAIGLGTALCTAVGHAIGEGRPELAVRRARIAMVMNVVYMGIVGIGVFYLARYPLMRFMTSDTAVIEAGAGVLTWAAVFQIFDALCITYIFALRGAGDTRWPAVATVLHAWVIFIGAGYLVSRTWPALNYHGPWMTCTLYITMLGVLLWWRFAREGWRTIDLFKRQDAPAHETASIGASSAGAAAGTAPDAATVEGATPPANAAMPAVETAEVGR